MGSGLGFALGGLLAGAGQGIATDIQNRREMALQQLRGVQQEDHDNRVAAADAARDERQYGYKRGLLATEGAIDIAKEDGKSRNKMKEIKAQGEQDVRLAGVKIQGDIKLATLKADMDRRNDAASKQLAAQIDGGQVQSAQQTADGRWFVIKKDGTTMTTDKVGVVPKAGGGPDEVPLTSRRGTSSPTPTPAASPTPAAAPDRPYSVDENYALTTQLGMGGLPGARAAAGGQTYTTSDLKAFAQARGWTLQQAREWARSQGFTLTGG